MVACTNTPQDSVEARLSLYNANGTNVGNWATSCEYHKHACNDTALRNSRSMYMGDSTSYVCGLNEKLYMIREGYRSRSNLELVEGISCKYSVILHTAK